MWHFDQDRRSNVNGGDIGVLPPNHETTCWSNGSLGQGMPIPVIDLFAGPGGLGEGFSAYRTTNGDRPFQVKLSIEKDPYAHTTLQLRSFVRQFDDGPPLEYYKAMADINKPLHQRLDTLFHHYPAQAEAAASEAWRVELGKADRAKVRERIAAALGDAEHWVLLGGPPCQAYSLAGRSRNKGEPDYNPEADHRQFLYVEYLQVIAEHQPSVFVMENVKGLLSATLQNQRIFARILSDLSEPVRALHREGRTVRTGRPARPSVRYTIVSLTERSMDEEGLLQDFVVRMERYGIPQARHRLILLGIRSDVLGSIPPGTLVPKAPVPARDVLEGLPRLRSGLSRAADSAKDWLACLAAVKSHRWFNALQNSVSAQMTRALDGLTAPRKDRGGEYISYTPSIRYNRKWYIDDRLEGVFNHATRNHIASDLHRYLYAACFGLAHRRSPVLADFPKPLLPDHQNVKAALRGGNFADRFRVQLADRPATTITSHIAKDGHYYIHYDPTQCRSLTVREAARLQTFPDNYFFCGPRTAQYVQVGNAVPPLLARQIADIVIQFLRDTGAVS